MNWSIWLLFVYLFVVKVLSSAMKANSWPPDITAVCVDAGDGFSLCVFVFFFSFTVPKSVPHSVWRTSALRGRIIWTLWAISLSSLYFASVHTNWMSSFNRKEIFKPPSYLIRRERHKLGKAKHFLPFLFLHGSSHMSKGLVLWCSLSDVCAVSWCFSLDEAIPSP